MEHYVRPDNADDQPVVMHPASRLQRIWYWFSHLLDDRTPSTRSNLLIRMEDGSYIVRQGHDWSGQGR